MQAGRADKKPWLQPRRPQRLRLVIEGHTFELESQVFPLSLSIGLIEIEEGTLTTGELLSQAAAVIYQAKAQEKNRVVVYGSK